MSQNTQAAAAAKSKFSVRDICYAGLFAAVIAVMAQISIPMPLGVPMTMQTFAITLAAVVLGSKLSAIATLVYLALGAVGVPVLANFSGGFDKFVGPTGGFLISFPLMAYIIGLGVEHRDAFKGAFVTAVIVGTVVNYVVGVALFCAGAKASVATGITASCVSMCGQVGWVGLLVPHLCRMRYGSNHLALVPSSVCVGAAFMVAVDTMARSVSAAELPLSILTAIIGAPFFIVLMRRSGGWQM